MRAKLPIVVIAFLLSLAVTNAAQNQPSAFEVAFVKPLQPPYPTGGGPWIASRGRFRAEPANVIGVIAMAYGILPAQVKGGPDWIAQESYSFDARAENPDAGP